MQGVREASPGLFVSRSVPTHESVSPINTAPVPTAAAATQSYDDRVLANLTRYQQQSTSGVPTTFSNFLTPDEALIEQHREVAVAARRVSSFWPFMAFFSLGFSSAAATMVSVMETIEGDLAWPLAIPFALLSVGGFGGIFHGISMTEHERSIARAVTQSRTARVPVPVGQAYSRLVSASREIDEEHGHSIEAIASARLAAEGARDIVTMLHGHHEDGTLHSPAAVVLMGEMYRLASEVDAYLAIHNTNRFAPSEDDALSAISNTGSLSFQPAVLTSRTEDQS